MASLGCLSRASGLTARISAMKNLHTLRAQTEIVSWINFLVLLRAGHKDYVLNEDALDYMRQQKLPRTSLDLLAAQLPKD